MCGIAGFQGRFDATSAEAMSSLIAHRGPDDAGIYRSEDAQLSLVHRRLAIIDLSPAGHQPMVHHSGRAVITFNGEIYNYRELRVRLESSGHTFVSQSDTEVLLALYLSEGPRFLTMLNGIFAFAIWDTEKRELLVARDGFGTKPLYFYEGSNGFAFASELKALLALKEVGGSLNANGLFSHLVYLWCPAPNTALREVQKLEPGHALLVTESRVKRAWQYYDPPCRIPVLSKEPEEAAENLIQMLESAVSSQLVSDAPLGTFLSGGLDSSAINVFARKHSSYSLQAFTIDIDIPTANTEGFAEDLPYARKVSSLLGVDLHEVKAGPEMATHLAEMVYHLDEPQADPAPLNALLICQRARQLGIKVLLSGAGGDDIFSGYRRHVALQMERYWLWLPKGVRKALATSSKLAYKSTPAMRRFSKAFAFAGHPDDIRLISYFFWIDPTTAFELLSKEFRSTISPGSVVDRLISELHRLPTDIPPLNRMLYLEQKFFLADHNLNYTDKMSMASGVEVRVPFLDTSLAEFASQIPINQKVRGSETKWLLKSAMKEFLPRDVVYRPKTGFGAPLRRLLHVELKPLVDEMLSEQSIKQRGIFDHLAVHNLIKRDRLGSIDGAYTLFAVVCIEVWCRLFLDGRHQLLKGKSPLPGLGF
jgi:asparagine synthase (glutamine-hydrolysing)